MPWNMDTTEAEFAALPFDKLQRHHDSHHHVHHPLPLSKSTSNKFGVYLKGTLSKEISRLAAKGRAFLPMLYVRQCPRNWVFPK
jgi:predicted glycoside hydrolase/deacetylase ChbG (UPF0249 family)